MRKINQPPSGTPSKATSEQPAVVVAPAEIPAPEAVVEEVVSDQQASEEQVSDAAIVDEAPKKRSRKKSDTSSDADGAAEEAQPTEELA